MKVLSSTPDLWKNAFLLEPGIACDMLGGDVCDPYWLGNGGSWLDAKSPAPRFTVRFYLPYRLLPWLRIRIGKWLIAAGWKPYQVNSPAYLRFTKPSDNYPESQALCFTVQSKWDFKGG